MATSSDNKQQGSKTSSSSSGGNKQSDTSKRGFASMDPAQQREIASEGGVPRMKKARRMNSPRKRPAAQAAKVTRTMPAGKAQPVPAARATMPA